MTTHLNGPVEERWGVLGGMGPLVSAEFMNTIYEEDLSVREQELPVVFLLSDPTIPDRTECLLGGQQQLLLERFMAALEQLVVVGATKIIICCVTIHALLPDLPSHLRKKILSLIDVTLQQVLESGGRHLLLCTEGTRRSGVFQNHYLWPAAKQQIILPGEKDQARIHELIYRIKSSGRSEQHVKTLQSILQDYKVPSYIAGCTELHLLAKEQEKMSGTPRHESCIDPLSIVAKYVRRKLQVPEFHHLLTQPFSA